jgi:hypothetical protein
MEFFNAIHENKLSYKATEDVLKKYELLTEYHSIIPLIIDRYMHDERFFILQISDEMEKQVCKIAKILVPFMNFNMSHEFFLMKILELLGEKTNCNKIHMSISKQHSNGKYDSYQQKWISWWDIEVDDEAKNEISQLK